ncbi:MAG: hypothetical protein IJR02_07000 [Bacteroidaceae bacterium]|nr:hypothetical protein [Bacteroidaceae bacterium]
MKLFSEFCYCRASKVMPLRILESICGVMRRRSALPLATNGTQERVDGIEGSVGVS